MADKKKFENPIEKKRKYEGNLTQERLEESITTFVTMEKELWDNIQNDEMYADTEKVFDTAIAAMVATYERMFGLGFADEPAGKDAAQDVLMPAT